MNDLERFKAVVNFEKPDYYPIFGFSGAPGFSGGCQEPTHKKLVEEGMPEWVGGSFRSFSGEGNTPVDTWWKYWGVTGADYVDFFPAEPTGKSIKCDKRVEGDFEILEYETGQVIRQVLDNDMIYSMPEFVSYPVRDLKSWEFYRDKIMPGKRWPAEKIREAAAKYKNRTRPLAMGVHGSWGSSVRNMMGTEAGATVLYDDYALAQEIIDYNRWINREYIFPMIEAVRPDAVCTGEDICYMSGMLISPEHFMQLCAPIYTEAAEVIKDCGVDLFAIDTDGTAMEFAPLAYKLGVNGMYPFEVHGYNDLFKLRAQCPKLVMFGWLEKEVVNVGNDHMIYDEIMGKVPELLKVGGYFPNGDHGIQPLITFENLCKFMTLLHEVTGNPEGEFPRMKI